MILADKMVDKKKSPSAHTTPFAQQSPPPRRKQSHESSAPSHQTQLINQFHQAFEITQPTITCQKPRSRIPFQWTVGASLVQPVGGDNAEPHQSSTLINTSQHFRALSSKASNAKFNTISNISTATTTKEQQPPKKLSSIANFLRSHSVSSRSSSSSTSSLSSSSSSPSVISPYLGSASSQVDLHQHPSGPSIIDQSRSNGIIPNPIPSHPDHSILETHYTRSSRQTAHTRQFSSSSSSFHPSFSQSDSEIESLEDDDSQQEVLSPFSQTRSSSRPPPLIATHTPTPSPRPKSTSTPTSHHLPSISFISHPSQSRRPSRQASPSSSNVIHTTPPSFADLPFACPSPNIPSRLKNRQKRPVPTRAPPLPRSQTPSLLIRPRFSLSSNLDLAIQPAFSYSGPNVDLQNASTDPQKRPLSGSKIDMIRSLGLGPNPINPPRLNSSISFTFPHHASSSSPSIEFTSPDPLTPYRSTEPSQTNLIDLMSTSHLTSPPRSPLVSRNKTKKFKDRFTVSHTAPLKIPKRQKTHHSDNPAPAPDAGRRIVSGLLSALSPTSARHVVGDLDQERRKAEFKKKISYPVLNHMSGDDTLSNCGQEHDDDTDCYNLTIEAAVRSLEGIRSNRSPLRADGQTHSQDLSINQPQDASTSSTQPDKYLDLSPVQAHGDDIILDDMSRVWKRKLRRRMSAKHLLTKSSRNSSTHADPEIESDDPSARLGMSTQSQGTHKQLRNKANARLKPLLHRVSSLSLRQRPSGNESDVPTFEPSKLGKTVDENNEEEELNEALNTSVNPELDPEESKPDSRFRWIRSSISKTKNLRSLPSSTIDLTTPRRQQVGPVINSSQSIREKRKIFEPEINSYYNESLVDLPPCSTSLISTSITPPGQPAHKGEDASVNPSVDKRSSVTSQRTSYKRKPTPAEIRLKDGTRSVKALVNKFEHQCHRSIPGSVGSDCAVDRTNQQSRDRGSTGIVRNSLSSIWSGGGSSTSRNNLPSRRGSKYLAREQRRKRRGWSSGNTFSDASEGVHEAEKIPVQKLKKKKKKARNTRSRSIFQNEDSSFSSFGCDLQEKDEDDWETVPMADHIQLPPSQDSSVQHLSRRRSASSIPHNPPTESDLKNVERNSLELNRQSSNSSLANSNVGLAGYESENQVGTDHEPQAPSERLSSDPDNLNENKTWSVVSIDQAQTVLEPQTVWMGDGSERRILVVGGRLQMAKKIPFPSFEDDAEFSQPVDLQQDLSASKEPPSLETITQSDEKTKKSNNRISSFLRTRKFDNDELDEDGDGEKHQSSGCYGQIGSKLSDDDLGSGMMCAVGASLQDSPTRGRGQRSWQIPMLISTSERSPSGSPLRPRSIPDLLLDPAPDLGENDQDQTGSSGMGTPTSEDMKQMYLSVDRCEGLGNKMFGSSITLSQDLSPPASCRRSGRRSTSTILNCALLRSSPNNSRPRSQPPMSTSTGNAIFESFRAFDSSQVCKSRSPLLSTSSRSSILGCDILDRTPNDNSTAITDLVDSREASSSFRQPKVLEKRVSITQFGLETPSNSKDVTLKDRFESLENTMDSNELLKFELARLERVQEKWRKFCLEVEDVLKRSRERWPDQVEADKILGDCIPPITKSTIDTFLANSQQLHRHQTHSITAPATEKAISQFTPPSKHPFDSRPITPSTVAGYPSFESSSLARKSSPHVVTLPVPSAFVSPERFLVNRRTPKIESERPPRVIKLSHRSRQLGLRQQTLSNCLGGLSLKPVTDRQRQARMISITSSSNGSFSSSRKTVLAEISINQSPVTLHDPTILNEHSKTLPSTKMAGDHDVKLSPLERSNRPSFGKWARENEGSQWLSASMRETRKPWRRSILNPNSHTIGFHGARQEIFERENQDSFNSSFLSAEAPEEVGVLVADGDQPHEFSDGFHTSESLRLKHRRRLNQSRSARDIGKAPLGSKSSKTELGVAQTSMRKQASLQTVKRQISEANNLITVINHRI